jgi:hypothetical protein
MNAADTPYTSACNVLLEIEENARIRFAFDRLILPNARVFFDSPYVDTEQRKSFSELAKLKSTDASTNYRGLLILVCSAFEYFSKQTIQNIVREMSDGAKSYKDIPLTVFTANFAYTGQYFQAERDAYESGAARRIFEDLSKGLNSCKEEATELILNPAMFVAFLGNCTAKQLEKRFKELALEAPFGDVLGGFPELRSHFGGGGARDVAKQARVKLEALIEKRNNLVHSSTISETVTIDEPNDVSAFVRALMGALKAIVSKGPAIKAHSGQDSPSDSTKKKRIKG